MTSRFGYSTHPQEYIELCDHLMDMHADAAPLEITSQMPGLSFESVRGFVKVIMGTSLEEMAHHNSMPAIHAYSQRFGYYYPNMLVGVSNQMSLDFLIKDYVRTASDPEDKQLNYAGRSYHNNNFHEHPHVYGESNPDQPVATAFQELTRAVVDLRNGRMTESNEIGRQALGLDLGSDYWDIQRELARAGIKD